tara:strand:- start:618 stop:947 length:330 start_codon:yes stop_codon:yes gene_type:complete
MPKHKGLREFSGEEATGLSLGQGGFDVLAGTSTTTAASKGISYWVAIKAINGTAICSAQVVDFFEGDDFTQTGVWGGSDITMTDGDMIYGAFKQIKVGTGDFVLAYRGK